ncbi:deoxyribose-phosphate aldolase [Winogradskyella sp. DF17]|uniref:Deoxyribose-phosphate aldolase n=1 Tax=Winogradskyella pelagia TaxID=2819984 RepID=A0ABS3T3Q3_9FLAO|nr:DUF6503 family protein [Winogradskyella sp. DF17]MBO3117380.1 deoxyribose-phosphate aldolase [Winogradskyella sp. DF17]
MKYLIAAVFSLLLLNCKNDKSQKDTKPLTATDIVNKAIDVAGGDKFKKSVITFNFRDHQYEAERYDGLYNFSRLKLSDSVFILDVLNNKGFERFINEKPVAVSDSMATVYTSSVNSVHYFSVLPYGLNDKAVKKSQIEQEIIKDKIYYKIKVTFSENGGGEDYEDVFVYWIDNKSYKVDYLAYSYNEVDGRGMRFREAYNERYIEGLRFVDYNNYKASPAENSLAELGKLFEANKLELLSKIELKQVSVSLIQRQ